MESSRLQPADDAHVSLGLGLRTTTLPAPEILYQAVFEQVAEGIFFFDAASKRILDANPAFRQLLDYTAMELVDRTLYEIIAHDRASIDANVRRITTRHYSALGERNYRRKDGTLIPVDVNATALNADGRSVLCVVVRDVSERRHAEMALRASEARLRTVMDNVPVSVLTVDRLGVVTFAAGQGLETLVGIPAQLIGRPIFVDIERTPEILAFLRRSLNGETITTTISPSKRVFFLYFAPLRDERGACAGAICVVVDSTKCVHAEAAMRRFEANLTPHEQIVLTLLSRSDLSYRQIADRLHIGYETVRTHLKRIADKLDVDSTRTAVIATARERGLLDDVSRWSSPIADNLDQE